MSRPTVLLVFLSLVLLVAGISEDEEIAVCSLSSHIGWPDCVGKDLCSFPGISCLNGSIVAIDPPPSQVPRRGPIPSQIGLLHHLKTLRLRKMEFDGTLPTQLGLLSSLQILDLATNQLSGSIPGRLIQGLSSLEELVLSQNILSGFVPLQIKDLLNLRILDLRFNKLEGFSQLVPTAPRLETLIFAKNEFKGKFFLTNHPTLKQLDIGANQFSGLEVTQNPSLQRLQAHSNQIAEINISGNLILTYLDLRVNIIPKFPLFLRDTDPQPLSTVLLSLNRISEPLPDPWSKSSDWLHFNKHLMNLDLSGNFISGEGIPEMAFISDATSPLGPLTPENCWMIDPKNVIPDPTRRSINLIGNQMKYQLLRVVELGVFNKRYAACANIDFGGIDNRVFETDMVPQCQKEEYFTSDFTCQSCYTPWTNVLQRPDTELMSLLPELPNDSAFARSFQTCTKCWHGERKRTRTLVSTRQCEENTYEPLTQTEGCSFPCADTTGPSSPLKYLLEVLDEPIKFWDEPPVMFLPLLASSLEGKLTMPTKVVSERAGNMRISYADFLVEAGSDGKSDRIRNLTERVCNILIPQAQFKFSFASPPHLVVEVQTCPPRSFPSPTRYRICESCTFEWETLGGFVDRSGWSTPLSELGLNQALIHDFGMLSFASCDGCSGRRIQIYRDRSGSPLCPNGEDIQAVECGYPCKGTPQTFWAALQDLQDPLQPPNKTTFLPLLINMVHPHIHISFSSTLLVRFQNFFFSEDVLLINVTGCKSHDEYKNVTKLILGVWLALKPNTEFESLAIEEFPSMDCISLVSSRWLNDRAVLLFSLFGTTIGVIVITLGVYMSFRLGKYAMGWIRFKTSDLITLPEEMHWSFAMYLKTPWRWERQGSDRSWFHFREFRPQIQEWKRVISFFNECLDGGMFKVESIRAVYHPNLVSAFLGTWNTRDSRKDSTIFQPTVPEDDPLLDQREFVSNCFRKRVSRMKWNIGNEGNWIVPVVHGTSYDSAMSICQRGFAALGRTDQGWYGRGIYFTTYVSVEEMGNFLGFWNLFLRYAFYTVHYMKSHDQPALIISWALPGHFYPVVEPPETKVLYRSAIVGGSSHYVVTGFDGRPSPNPSFDELVIANEFSIVPAFILTISNKTKKKLLRKYHEMATENPVPIQPQTEDQKQKLQEQVQSKAQKNKQELKPSEGEGPPSEQELSHIIAIHTDSEVESEEESSSEDFLLGNSRLGRRDRLQFERTL